MHIIKQLSEDEFVIKMDDYDLDKHDAVRIAHDYVQFYSPTTINIKQPQDWEPYGRFKSIARNLIHGYSDIQIWSLLSELERQLNPGKIFVTMYWQIR